MSVCIVLLNYGRAADTLACLDSLRAVKAATTPPLTTSSVISEVQTSSAPTTTADIGLQTTTQTLTSTVLSSGMSAGIQIVVVDNASPDDSVARFKARLAANPGEFQLIESEANLGYSGGCNLAMRAALDVPSARRTEFIWLLNNDTTVEPDALSALVREAQRTGGLAGSLLVYPDGAYQQVGTRINPWTGRTRGYPENVLKDGMSLETLSGASMLIPLKALERVGLFDESFFLYFEDGDFSLRCRRAGFPLTLAMGSRVYHQEGATTGRKSLATQYYYHRNRLRLLFRFAAPAQKLVLGFYAVFRLLRSVLKSLTNRDEAQRTERRHALRVQWLALDDFRRGVSGRCPHNLSHR
jgi:GT2 family glycosyltransferase